MADVLLDPVYEKGLVDLLYKASTDPDGVDLAEGSALINAGYIILREDGKWRTTGKALEFLFNDYPVYASKWSADTVASFTRSFTERAAKTVASYVGEGYLVVSGDTYRITDRGYRIAARSFRRWLVCQADSESPPDYIELLDLDGCTQDTLGKAYSVHDNRGQYYWKRLGRAIRESLSSEDMAVIRGSCGVRNTKKPNLPDWCSRLVAESVKDGRECLVNVNRLSGKTWGMGIKQASAR